MSAPWSHEPPGCECPFCLIQAGHVNDRNQSSDVVAVTPLAYARISPTWWPGNPGGVLVIPRAHHENLYEIPTEVGHEVWDLAQRIATAERTPYADLLAAEVGLPRRFD